ncbi:TetR/AcrR family transcriptional regulator [Nocardia otitidiscaviarum]|uniref:TetR/AcrR family transcriptional regulator n=1 Tax=Nocardia otitidiscaviarum TaxID=1823 RepID=A0A516NH64_9NOCA|nr:TetR/AcrR family transcriptional regulator [Nocardia otitidiscaviarum]MCP9625212.1 TetR/AcrR family transcriptional regulator [Nocardia otitidiscaviarum]QDP78248.1 TetR/AcrR family transcriptional regulator [Nocardia otitidiscaviarum]
MTAVRRLPRAERRAQILDAATRVFARGGYAATGLDDVAAAAGITHVIVYRHFTSKSELYRAVLDRACAHLAETVGVDHYDEGSVPALLRAAAADPDGFRLLFRHAVREPEFCDVVDGIRTASADIAERHLAAAIPEGPWREWAVRLVPTLTLEAVIAWLDAGQPEPDHAAERIERVIGSVVQAAQPE